MEFQQLQSWYGLIDSPLTCQDRYPPMTQHNYVGGQVSSSSCFDFIFLTPSLNSLVTKSFTELFPNSDHYLLISTLVTPSSKNAPSKWLKVLPCNVSGWQFKKDFKSSFRKLDQNCSREIGNYLRKTSKRFTLITIKASFFYPI